MTLSDEEILRRAALIVKSAQDAEKAELNRLYRLYGKAEHKYPQELGKPKALGKLEALLVAVLDRTRYKITAECPTTTVGTATPSAPMA